MYFSRTVGLESGGYSIAKVGNVVLTRLFPSMRPSPSDEGVKAFAICLWYVPTRMVIGEHEMLSREESELRVAQEIHKETMSWE